ncbi:unnamed protein product [Fraxinus pennsylvanica]|uniref:BZIP domain-containing protein n=1 Tax=Fraxinus pennsylvanica TaxID=56036 RepID=A0AAD1ZCQ4_9LAMI|nr:unnamed protein product [Fraxinus pennsylvanica]
MVLVLNKITLRGTQVCNDSLGWTEACTDALGRTQACTHAHACNTDGPDNSHTHTCYHIHTQVMPAPSEIQSPSDDNAESVERKPKSRPVGNREAVRKYREKKKALNASLEDEVVRLRDLNRQLMKRLQGQALLEAENARLKCLLLPSAMSQLHVYYDKTFEAFLFLPATFGGFIQSLEGSFLVHLMCLSSFFVVLFLFFLLCISGRRCRLSLVGT